MKNLIMFLILTLPSVGFSIGTIEIPATNPESRINTVVSDIASYGPVIMNAPPYDDVSNEATYLFYSDGGKYLLYATLAAAESRPLDVYINDKLVLENALGDTTGCWEFTCQRSFYQGVVTLAKGFNRLTIHRSSYFPHISGFTLYVSSQ